MDEQIKTAALNDEQLEQVAGGAGSTRLIQYTVREGDTLSRLAKKYKTTVKTIWDHNRKLIKDPNLIRVGWVLEIPDNR